MMPSKEQVDEVSLPLEQAYMMALRFIQSIGGQVIHSVKDESVEAVHGSIFSWHPRDSRKTIEVSVSTLGEDRSRVAVKLNFATEDIFLTLFTIGYAFLVAMTWITLSPLLSGFPGGTFYASAFLSIFVVSYASYLLWCLHRRKDVMTEFWRFISPGEGTGEPLRGDKSVE